MLGDQELTKLKEDILLLIPYAVPEEEQEQAIQLADLFAADFFALGIVKDYYQTLPEAREEALVKICVLEEREQVDLMLLSTTKHHYFYLTDGEEGVFLGEWDQGLQDIKILSFFGYADGKRFAEVHGQREECREYQSLERMNEEFCPSCGVQTGSMHLLGCPVEVCPWCGGQLSRCNCRFEQLNVDAFTDEAMLDAFVVKLEEKGRIAYSKEQRPTFMSEEALQE